MRRQWFRAKDGTFYRNVPLIMDEQRRTCAWRIIRQEVLADEYADVFRQGVVRKDRLVWWRDKEVEPAPFREVYPDKPELWIFDRGAS